MRYLASCLVAITALFSTQNAFGLDKPVETLGAEFLEFKFGPLTGEAEQAEISRLVDQANQFLKPDSEDPQELILRARILAYQASMLGGLKGLAMAKEAKALLEKSLEIDASAQDGYAHVLLGQLYSRVPGFPIAFGSKKQAEKHFKSAMEIDPQGFEPNFSYAEHCIKYSKPKKAKQNLVAAQSGLKDGDFAREEKQRRIQNKLKELGGV